MSPSPPGARSSYDNAPLLAGLQPAQREAVLAGDPVVCVLAGAGAGKTRVLTLRVARRLDEGSAHPTHVLVCTFSRKAAEELRSRLWTLGAGAEVTAGTFHRTALRLLARYRADRGEAPPAVGDRRALLAAVLQGGGTRDRSRKGRSASDEGHDRSAGRGRGRGELARLDAEIGWAKARLVAPADYESAARFSGRRPGIAPARVAELYERYEQTRRRRGVLDLDDLLWHCGDLMESEPGFGRAVRWWHRHLFVDEAQDMNEAQYRLLRLLVGDRPDLFVVGDPNQSVYGWNGADPALLRRITEEFEGTRVVRLDANHRCTPQVVAAASAVLDLAGPTRPVSTRPDGPLPVVAALPTDEREAAWVARRAWLAHRPGRHWSSIAVLARTNAQLNVLAAALEAEGVPHRIAGSELGPASDVARDATPADPLVGHRVQPSVAATSGVGSASVAATSDAGSGDDCLEDAGLGIDDVAMDDAGTDDAGVPEERWTPRSFEGTGGQDRGGADPDRGSDRVVLSTFHRAKGLQWPVVFVVGLSDGTVPLVTARSKAARAEERRLLYVALTRAEDELVCSWARHADELGAARGDEPRAPSPWLEPVRRAVDVLREEQTAAAPDRAAEHLARLRRLLPSATAGASEEP